jgi:hypothetical protein
MRMTKSLSEQLVFRPDLNLGHPTYETGVTASTAAFG